MLVINVINSLHNRVALKDIFSLIMKVLSTVVIFVLCNLKICPQILLLSLFLQENARELELELREDIDLANAENRKLQRAREVAHEVIADHESTIHKFRDLVNKVQDQNLYLKVSVRRPFSLLCVSLGKIKAARQ